MIRNKNEESTTSTSTSPHLTIADHSVLSVTTPSPKRSSTEEATPIPAGNAFDTDSEIRPNDVDKDGIKTRRRKKLRRRVVRKLGPMKKYRRGKTRRRKRFRANKLPDTSTESNTQIQQTLQTLQTAKKDIDIYNSYANRAVYYRIYNGK